MALLDVEQLSVGFGGLVAVDNIGFSIDGGEICGLIGPNGAGKTTLFNAISGLVDPSGGKIYFAGQDITALPAHKRAARGIRRTFQTVQLVQDLTVLENVLIGLHAELPDTVLPPLFGFGARRTADEMAEIRVGEVLSYLAIEDLMQREVKSLTFAEQRYVEIARALVAKPKLLLLDEPAAGLTAPQIKALDTLLVRLRNDWGVTVILIEHLLSLVLNVCSRIIVIDRGAVIADGTGPEIVADRKVRAAYLGEEADA